jgi:hypothetical protein
MRAVLLTRGLAEPRLPWLLKHLLHAQTQARAAHAQRN